MKVKIDHVSNSSSTSYVFFGWKLHQDRYNFADKFIREVLEEEVPNDDDFFEDIIRGENALGISCFSFSSESSIVDGVGRILFKTPSSEFVEFEISKEDLISLIDKEDVGLLRVKRIFNLDGEPKIFSLIEE